MASKNETDTARSRGGPRPKAPSSGPIVEGAIYSLDEFLRRTRLAKGSFRSAKRNGLVSIRVGNLTFIRGSDFNAFLDTLAANSKQPSNAKEQQSGSEARDA